MAYDKDGQKDIGLSVPSIGFAHQAVEALAPALLHFGQRGGRLGES